MRGFLSRVINNRKIGRLEHVTACTGGCSTRVRGAGIKSVNTGIMIGNGLNNQIFELSQLAS